ncbi:MAG: hypothetical protein RLZZ262_1724 [Bacteroidota bacterium]|jgi:hypothetical protein
MNESDLLLKKIRRLLVFFIVCLVLSGVTAFPIETELRFANEHFTFLPNVIREWLATVYAAVKTTNENYPYLSYGCDWLAFAHIVIAIAFIGPYRDPVKNIWVIEFGMIACVLILPLAFIAGPIRSIPLYWQLIDCSFGIIGIIPLMWCRNLIKRLELRGK